VAVLTNGALLFQPEVREELAAADLVMPTLDAAHHATFRQINRPWPRFRIAEIVEGMAVFRGMFTGQLWIEVMLVRGLNDDEVTLLEIRDALARIRPDRVQINVPIRPPAELWVEIPDDAAVERATAILGEAAEVVAPYEGCFDLSGFADVAEAILAIIRRHPMRQRRLMETLDRWVPGEVKETLARLESGGQARKHSYRSEVFWEYTGRVFGERRPEPAEGRRVHLEP
jgi:wyosine [tRNA(Phe)-imidazoG37] synthetase (radical SAM superfamily)